MKNILGILIAATLAFFAASNTVGQTEAPDSNAVLLYKSGDPANWPTAFDAVLVAPDNHKILMENENVRVLEVSLLPGVVEPLHSHNWPSVLYIQSAGEFIDRDIDGNIVFDTRKLDAPLKLPLTMWKDPEAPHSIENLSKTETIRLIRVELKQ